MHRRVNDYKTKLNFFQTKFISIGLPQGERERDNVSVNRRPHTHTHTHARTYSHTHKISTVAVQNWF